MINLEFEPAIAPPLWITLALLAAAALTWYAWNRPSAVPRGRWWTIIGLTGAAIAGVLLILLNPIWLEVVPPPAGKPVLTVLLDESASMAVQDIGQKNTRFASAVQTAADVVRRLDNRYDVRLRTFGEMTAAATPDELAAKTPDKAVSDFTSAIAGALAADHAQGHGLLLLSDGIHNGSGGIQSLREALRSAKAMNVPIYTTTFGTDAVLNDVEVVAARPQELAFVGQNVPLTVGVKQRGRLAERVELVLLRDDEELDRRETAIAANGTATVRFETHEDASGLYRYEIRALPLDGEATLANNNATVLLRVTEKPVRALLLEGKPYWDGKFLLRTLATDPSLEVDAIVRMSESRFMLRSLRLPRKNPAQASGATTVFAAPVSDTAGQTPVKSHQRVESMNVIEEPFSFLEGPDGLAACQVVILGRDADVFLNDAVVERLRNWISRDGGSLVCFRGAPVSQPKEQFARLLPVRWSPARETRFRPHLTERGMEADWLASGSGTGETGLEQMPSLATVASQERPKPMSVVLATSDKGGPSVMTYQPYGTGRVVALEGAGMWRWAFLAPQYQQHDQVYGELWQSLLRWLVSVVGLIPGQDIALRTDKVNYGRGEAVTAFLLLREDRKGAEPPQVELLNGSADEGTRFTPVPVGEESGAYRVALGLLPEGTYRLRTVGETKQATAGAIATAAFDVRPYFGEQLDVQARPDLMAHIAEETGGSVLSQDAASQLAKDFESHLSRSRPERVRRLTAWDRWWVLAGIVAMWGAAWGLRRSSGLI